MKVLVVGSGGREHALVWKISQSDRVSKVYCVPGNAGMEGLAECVPIEMTVPNGMASLDGTTNPDKGIVRSEIGKFDRLLKFAKENKIDLTVIGPDNALADGIVDAFMTHDLKVFGPRKDAAIIEYSKVFSKDIMKKYNIPTAAYEVFTDADRALGYLASAPYPVVIKADGLALGKGVLICKDYEEAVTGVRSIMLDKVFSSSGDSIVVEEYLTGREVSMLCFCDGTHIRPMASAQDYKRARDGDEGLNTGGMGAFSPTPFYTKEIDEYCKEHIYQPTMDAMKKEGRDFVGVLFCGLMITPSGVKVIEYNARFGDPETQVVLPRLENDIVDIFEACINGRLDEMELRFKEDAAVCVVLASDGYPEHYEKGYEIRGLDRFRDSSGYKDGGKCKDGDSYKDGDGYICFHAGTKHVGGKVVTNGGRVLGVTALGKDLSEARDNAYEATEWIEFENKYMRNDIGK